ncbi:MAG: MFS transporter, partial [Anaerolineales bacterium]
MNIESAAGDTDVIQMSALRRKALTVALLLGTFLASIEVTVVAAAMPSIVESLGGLALYPWVFSSYLLTQTVSIPLYGRLADLYGRRMVYVVGVLLFLVGSALSGLAPSMEFLVAARAVQGLGAGCVLPLTMTIFGDLFEVSLRTKLQGLFSLVWGVSSLAGPLVGGAIVLHFSWRWVF